MNYQSSTRTKLTTTNFLSQPPVSDSRLLLRKAIEFEENCDIMTDVGGIDPNIAGLAVNVLDNLVSKLVADGQWNQLLSIPLDMVKHHNPNDVAGMLKMIKVAGRDMMLRAAKMPQSTPNQRSRFKRNTHAAMVFEKVVQICFNYCEGRPYSAGALCTFGHKGATSKICDDKGYLSTGFCKTFGDCKNKHPWDEGRWRKPEDAVAKMMKQDITFNDRKGKTHLRSIMMMEQMNAEEMEQLQVDAVPRCSYGHGDGPNGQSTRSNPTHRRDAAHREHGRR